MIEALNTNSLRDIYKSDIFVNMTTLLNRVSEVLRFYTVPIAQTLSLISEQQNTLIDAFSTLKINNLYNYYDFQRAQKTLGNLNYINTLHIEDVSYYLNSSDITEDTHIDNVTMSEDSLISNKKLKYWKRILLNFKTEHPILFADIIFLFEHYILEPTWTYCDNKSLFPMFADFYQWLSLLIFH